MSADPTWRELGEPEPPVFPFPMENIQTRATAKALLQRAVEGITYKPGWSFAITEHGDTLYVEGYHTEANSRHPDATLPDFSRRIPVMYPAYTVPTIEAACAWLRHCIHEWEVHEADEWLRFNSRHVHDPHVCHQCRIGGCRA